MYYPIIFENRCNANAGVVRDALRETLSSWKFAQSIGIAVHSNLVTSYEGEGYRTADLRQLFQIAQNLGDLQEVPDEYSNFKRYFLFFVDERLRLYPKYITSDNGVSALQLRLKTMDLSSKLCSDLMKVIGRRF